MYNHVTADILSALSEIVGPENVLSTTEALETYSHDETAGLSGAPEVAVRVNNVDQVSAILQLAQRERVPVTPRGAGTGLSGGAVPVHGGIVLSLEKMNRIVEIDHENLMVTVEPGVITADLHRAVEAEGLFYPPDPASLDSCSIGGNIAEGAGGPRAVKYGTTKDYVCGLEAVLPSGEIIHTGGKLVKDVTGYNLTQLLVGSEGTLAVVTQMILRLIPLPPARVDLLVPYDDFQAAADTVSALVAKCIVPATIEFMERDAFLSSERLLGKAVPYNDAAAHLLIALDGNDERVLEEEYGVVGDLCLDYGARDVLVALDRATRDRLWEARRMIVEALKAESPVNLMEDVVVPRARLPVLLRGIQEMAQRHGVRMVNFGHVGDGNVHVNVLKDDLPLERWEALAPVINEEVYQLCLSLGGMITGEHGIGLTRRQYLPLAVGEVQVALMRGIKQAFDPHNILNPGKIF